MYELYYSIDKARSEKDNLLVIKVQAAERQGLTLLPLKSFKPLTIEILKRLMTPKDANLIPFLIEEEKNFVKKTTGRMPDERTYIFDTIHIHTNSVQNALKQFVLCGKLTFSDKPLAIDLYGRSELYYTVQNGLLQAYLKTEKEDFPLSACDFICKSSPHCYVRGVQLKCLSTEISWQDLKAAYQGQYRPIEELQAEADEEMNAPRVVGVEALTLQKNEPLPVLILKDRQGSFANLFFTYGKDTTLISLSDPSPQFFNSMKKPLGKRQNSVEAGWEKDLLETGFIKKSVGSSHYYCPLDQVAKSLAFLLEIGWQVHDWQNNTVLLPKKTDLQATSSQNAVMIKGKMPFESFEANLSDIVGAFNRRERFAQIAPGQVCLLPNQWQEPEMELLAAEGEIIGDTIQIKKNQIGVLADLFESCPAMTLDDSLRVLKDKLHAPFASSPAMPDAAFCGTLRPYQLEGLKWLLFLFEHGLHGLLADDMGLGKTVQLLAFLSKIPLQSPILIVVPTSLLFNWKKEIERFLPSYSILMHHGAKRDTFLERLDRPQIILTSYATMRQDFSLLSSISYTALIIDEGQAIKNAQSQTFQAIVRLKSQFRLSITGTPIENSLQELWAHFQFLIPGLLGNAEEFNSEIQAGLSDMRFLKRIKRKVAPFLLRRCKEDVAKDLPEKIEQTVWIEMEEGQRRVYEQFLSGVRRNLISKIQAEGLNPHRIEIFEAILRLRQICCHPLLVQPFQEEAEVESAKLEALLQDLEVALAEKRKVLVYSQFTSMLALIGKRLTQKGWRYAYLDGSTQNREKVVSQFQEDASIFFFLISLKAGGVGLNLTAADYVFLYDPWWNSAAENQAIDRAHRIGRTDTVIAKRYVISESIEEKMMKLKAIKSSLASNLLDQDLGAGTLSVEDLLFLLD